MSKILKSLKRKITVLAVAMIAIQPVLVGGMMMPAETQAAVANFDLTVPAAVTIDQSILVPETSGVPTGGNATVDAAVIGLTSIPVTLANTGGAASANVRINPINAGANIQLWAKDSANNWYDINVTGWGPGGGFSAPIGYNATTPVYAISDVVGSYPLTANLILVSDASPVTHATGTITVVDATAPVITVTNPDSTLAQTKTVTATKDIGTLSMAVNSAGVCDNSILDSAFVPYASTTFSTEADNGKTICYKADAGGGNTSYQLSTPITGIDTTEPGEVTGLTATPGNNKVTLDWTKPADVDFAGVNIYRNDASSVALNTTLVTTETYDDVTAANGTTYTYTVKTVDTVGNESAGRPVIVTTAPIVLSPVVTTVVPAVATVVVPETVPVDEQFGGDASSDQGEVKADTTIKADEGNKEENKDEQKEDVKEKKNIPLWGIIFLLVLAGIGGYLFYSQNPEKTNGKK